MYFKTCFPYKNAAINTYIHKVCSSDEFLNIKIYTIENIARLAGHSNKTTKNLIDKAFNRYNTLQTVQNVLKFPSTIYLMSSVLLTTKREFKKLGLNASITPKHSISQITESDIEKKKLPFRDL